MPVTWANAAPVTLPQRDHEQSPKSAACDKVARVPGAAGGRTVDHRLHQLIHSKGTSSGPTLPSLEKQKPRTTKQIHDADADKTNDWDIDQMPAGRASCAAGRLGDAQAVLAVDRYRLAGGSARDISGCLIKRGGLWIATSSNSLDGFALRGFRVRRRRGADGQE
jgi:hypothetical protein